MTVAQAVTKPKNNAIEIAGLNFFGFIAKLIFRDCRSTDNDPTGRHPLLRPDPPFSPSLFPGRFATPPFPPRTEPSPRRCRAGPRPCADRRVPRRDACLRPV